MKDATERDLREEFSAKYRLATDPTRQRIERAVLGSDYGANSYTTMDQANDLGVRLRLGPDVRLLDLGSGSGWPGLHLAATTGCRVVLADQPREGLLSAQRRARDDGIAERCSFVQSSGDALPLRNECFDAVTHTDVLC